MDCCQVQLRPGKHHESSAIYSIYICIIYITPFVTIGSGPTLYLLPLENLHVPLKKGTNLWTPAVFFNEKTHKQGCHGFSRKMRIHENYNTPLEHTPGNPPGQLWKESLYSLLVKVWGCVSKVWWNNLRPYPFFRYRLASTTQKKRSAKLSAAKRQNEKNDHRISISRFASMGLVYLFANKNQLNIPGKVTCSSPIWRSLNHLKGHVFTVPKRSRSQNCQVNFHQLYP